MSNFSWKKINKSVVVLAPMAGITIKPFRSICKEMGADIVFTPMLSANAIVYNKKETLKIAEFDTKEQPVIIQIFGNNGEIMAKAVQIAAHKMDPAGIDINMGCPAPKITGNECGSALLKDFSKALEIVKCVRKDYSGELSVKLRLGWETNSILEFVKQLENSGVDAVSIHGRTRMQKYLGEADWQPIFEVAKSVQIPVIGNGDVNNWQIAHKRLENTSILGVMIGRGAINRPWIFKEIKRKKDIFLSAHELIQLIREHAKRQVMYYQNEYRAIIEMRKHLCWYLKGFKGAAQLRKKAVRVNSLADVEEVLNNIEVI